MLSSAERTFEREAAERQRYELQSQIQPFVDESARQDVAMQNGNAEYVFVLCLSQLYGTVTNNVINLSNLTMRPIRSCRSLRIRTGVQCTAAVKWLYQNKHHFKMEVIKLAVLSVELKDPQYADIIDARSNALQLKVRLPAINFV